MRFFTLHLLSLVSFVCYHISAHKHTCSARFGVRHADKEQKCRCHDAAVHWKLLK